MFTDMPNRCYKVFPAPEDRFSDPSWPDLSHANDLPSRVPRQGPVDRQRRASALPEVGREGQVGFEVNVSDLPFAEIWLHDFEFMPKSGEHPDVICLVAHELRSGQVIQRWWDTPDKPRSRPPYRTDHKAVFVNFVANAECICHLALGWPIPKNVLDLSPMFRRQINGLDTPGRQGIAWRAELFQDRRNRHAREGRRSRPYPSGAAVHSCGAKVDSRILPQRRR